MSRSTLAAACWLSLAAVAAADDGAEAFRDEVAPLLRARCVRCHAGGSAKGGVDLSTAATVVEGRGSDAWVVVPGRPDESYLLEVVSGDEPAMPKAGDPLTDDEVAALRRWIAAGAGWPEGEAIAEDPLDWWSLRPLDRPPLPGLAPEDRAWPRNPIDVFILAKLRDQGLSPSPEADRRTLIRRVTFDLTGLPPSPEEVDAFLGDDRPDAYERLVDRLLASPRHGERWARHWMDAVHYGDTHGYDKDKVRPNAWPYRDYLIRSFNDDTPYGRFVEEQLAGDDLYPGTADGVIALGFLAAGPWDFVGQVEVADGTMEKRRVRNVDRDDMVAATMSTFVSLTAHCARCHDHKFDPIAQEDYYSLQAVFAAVDRADRPFDPDPAVARRRRELAAERDGLEKERASLQASIRERAGPELAEAERRIAELSSRAAGLRPEYGYHSGIEASADVAKWVQVDLGRSVPIGEVVVVPAYDDFAGIGAGFGFPPRYRVEVGEDPEAMQVVLDRTGADAPNPGIVPQAVALDGRSARYVRFTASRLATRKNDYNFALAELMVRTPDGTNAAAGAEVTALDSIEAPARWSRANLVDGIYRGSDEPEVQAELARLNGRRDALLAAATDESTRRRLAEADRRLAEFEAALGSLPDRRVVYAAATEFEPQGNFRPTRGEPRPIHVLRRGSEKDPLDEVGPGTVGCVEGLPSRFDLSAGADESARRAALARWIVDRRNPLTWRSIVNRAWHHHVGRGIVESTNDFGRMGSEPTHPELLDWLAAGFRDGGQSLKELHRLIVTSATYRQSSDVREDGAGIDAGNRYLWRMNRRRLGAEAVRDAVLAVSGRLRDDMGGPGFRAFGFIDDHSPHYLYDEAAPDDPATQRRSVYRFIVRSVPDPFMTTLDCADPSLLVDRRNETLTPLQALTLLNDDFMICMAGHYADRAAAMADDRPSQIAAAYRLAFQREPDAGELAVLVPLAERHCLATVCRLILNANEFLFVD